MTATRTFNRPLVVALAAVAALLFATTAFTASVDTTAVAETAGYGETTVSGAALESLAFTYDATGETITEAALVFTGDQSTNTVTITFDGATAESCTVAAYDDVALTTTATCASLAQSTSTAGTVGVSVTS
ncbi:MAG: hypothetical protein WD080_05190 [Egibacteraceae bacterium]